MNAALRRRWPRPWPRPRDIGCQPRTPAAQEQNGTANGAYLEIFMTLSPSAGKVFENLVWESDRVLLGDLVFRLEHYKNERWELGENCFHFFKTKGLVDQYERFWRIRRDFKPRNVLELGIWDGGALPFGSSISSLTSMLPSTSAENTDVLEDRSGKFIAAS
jgi:hypothetical protein